MALQGIVASAEKNAQLLQLLAEYDYAPSALAQHKRYVKDLNEEIKTTDALLKSLQAKTHSEFADHKKYRDSVLRRFAYKVGGKKEKFEATAAKEEKEYFDALIEESKTRRRQEELAKQLEEARQVGEELGTVVKKRADTQKELDTLYDSIFAGATVDFPEEDVAEDTVKTAQAFHDQIQGQLDLEDQTRIIFNKVEMAIKQAHAELEGARSSSEYDMYGFSFADYTERSHLANAQHAVDVMHMDFERAVRLNPAVQSIGRVEMPQGNMLSDVFFDSLHADIKFHRKITAAIQQMQELHARFEAQVELLKQRKDSISFDLREAKRMLGTAREDLQQVRTEAFAKVVSVPVDVPPAYSA